MCPPFLRVPTLTTSTCGQESNGQGNHILHTNTVTKPLFDLSIKKIVRADLPLLEVVFQFLCELGTGEVTLPQQGPSELTASAWLVLILIDRYGKARSVLGVHVAAFQVHTPLIR